MRLASDSHLNQPPLHPESLPHTLAAPVARLLLPNGDHRARRLHRRRLLPAREPGTDQLYAAWA